MAIQWKAAGEPGEQPTVERVTQTNGEKPNLREAIVLVLTDRGGPMKLADLNDELARRGWSPNSQNPKSQIAARLSKMLERGQVLRIAPATYTLPTENAGVG